MKVLLLISDKELRDRFARSLENYFQAVIPPLDSSHKAFDHLLEDNHVDLIVAEEVKQNVNFFKYLLSVESEIPCILIHQTLLEKVPTFPDLNLLARVEAATAIEDCLAVIQREIKTGALLKPPENSNFCRIKTELLIKMIPLRSDVYIRLSANKFVKLFKKGDIFDSNDLEKYLLHRRVQYLYLQSSDCPEFITKFKTALATLLKTGTVIPESVVEIVRSAHELTMEIKNQFGITPEVQELVSTCIKGIIAGIRSNQNLALVFDKLIKSKGQYISDHSVLLAHVACYIAQKMDWHSNATYEKLAYAALLHDMQFTNHELARCNTVNEVRSKGFRAEDEKEFLYHPIAAVDFLRRFSALPADVETIILQHHETPDGKGFPKKLDARQIAPLSCVFIVGHEIVSKIWEGVDFHEALTMVRKTHGKGNFRKILATMPLPPPAEDEDPNQGAPPGSENGSTGTGSNDPPPSDGAPSSGQGAPPAQNTPPAAAASQMGSKNSPYRL